MTRPTESKSETRSSSSELLERARLTLQAIQFRERAASYSAAAASLRAAMVHAENGNPKRLQEWLDLESHQFECDLGLQRPEAHLAPSQEPQFKTVGSIRIDQPHFDLKPEPSDSDFAETPSSPWERMENGVIARLNARRPSTTLPEAESHATSILPPAIAAILAPAITAVELRKPKAGNLASENESLVPTELKTLIQGIDRDVCNSTVKRWWKVPHIWVSLLVHASLILCLGVLTITLAKEPALLSVVSSSVEAENVLLESPMEMVSELESLTEPFPTINTPALNELHSHLSMEGVSIQGDSTTLAQHSVSTAVANSVTESTQSAVMGSKMLAGAEFYGVKATGNTFVYIIDSSPSMRRDGAFEAARQEIIRSLSSMKQKQRYFVSFFGKEIDPMVFEFGVVERYPVYAKPENLRKTIDWLGRVQVQKEGLPPNNALTEAIAMQPDGIFLLFDGDTKVDVAKHLQRINRSDDIISAGMPKVPIHVIHFYLEEFQVPMRKVANENGGTYRFVTRPQRPPKGNR